MTSFVLRTEDEDDIGFLIFASHDGDWPPSGPNDCVLTAMPDPALLADHPCARFVTDHKGQEWVAEIVYTDTDMIVRIDFSSGWRFELHSNSEANEWSAVREGERLRGTGMLL